MDKVVYALGRWFAEHNLPTDGVRIIIEFPGPAQQHRAAEALEKQFLTLAPMRRGPVQGYDTIGGFRVDFTTRGV